MKKSEKRKLVAKWKELQQMSKNHDVSKKLKDIEFAIPSTNQVYRYGCLYVSRSMAV